MICMPFLFGIYILSFAGSMAADDREHEYIRLRLKYSEVFFWIGSYLINADKTEELVPKPMGIIISPFFVINGLDDT